MFEKKRGGLSILLPSGRPREASHFFPLNRGTEGVSSSPDLRFPKMMLHIHMPIRLERYTLFLQ
jgi:hypothetical protein